MTAIEVMNQTIKRFGTRMRVEEIADAVYNSLKTKGFDPVIVNDRYIDVDEVTHQFIRNRKENTWTVKVCQ